MGKLVGVRQATISRIDLYNPVHCARIILDAYNRGIINFDEKYGKNKV
ncbi:hypothetical protein [Spiroplasma endosymbiont of Andrena trimmerana]